VRAGAPGITPGDGRDRMAEESPQSNATDIAVGMIRAAGEFTRLSISAWKEFVKRATRRH